MYLLFFAVFIFIILINPYVPADSILRIENSLYESLQYIVLLVGAGFALKDLHSTTNPRVYSLAQASLPAWLLIQGREINWGRVIFQYAQIYKLTIAYPIVAFLFLYSLYKVCKHKIFQNIWRLLKNKLLPRYEFITLFLFAFGHYWGEKVIYSTFIEMSMEWACYVNLLLITYRVRELFKNDDYQHLLK